MLSHQGGSVMHWYVDNSQKSYDHFIVIIMMGGWDRWGGVVGLLLGSGLGDMGWVSSYIFWFLFLSFCIFSSLYLGR